MHPCGKRSIIKHGHGTHVAGTIAAYDNAFGVIGVAGHRGRRLCHAERPRGRCRQYKSLGGGVSQALDAAEPGAAIKATWLNGGYNMISGTSMAAPHLAGILLAGGVRTGGFVTGDPDGQPDAIGVR